MFWNKGYENVSAAELKELMAKRGEGEYVVVDVRQPAEYTQGHIPGARHIPLSQVLGDMKQFDPDKETVFYCHSGVRSRAAAKAVATFGHMNSRLLNLDGGIVAWDGMALPDTPKVELFDRETDLTGKLLAAIEMEKGAYLLYDGILRKAADKPFICSLMEELAPMEEAHAKVVYSYLKKQWDRDEALQPFDALFAASKGGILEGGKDVAELEPWIDDALSGDCMPLAELALEIEYNAYDLYRSVANQAAEQAERDAFLSLAEQEKAHIRLIADKLDSFLPEDAGS